VGFAIFSFLFIFFSNLVLRVHIASPSFNNTHVMLKYIYIYIYIYVFVVSLLLHNLFWTHNGLFFNMTIYSLQHTQHLFFPLLFVLNVFFLVCIFHTSLLFMVYTTILFVCTLFRCVQFFIFFLFVRSSISMSSLSFVCFFKKSLNFVLFCFCFYFCVI
jgi:hypothetical protein